MWVCDNVLPQSSPPLDDFVAPCDFRVVDGDRAA